MAITRHDNYKDKTEGLASRKKTVGGSEISILFGDNQYSSYADLLKQKKRHGGTGTANKPNYRDGNTYGKSNLRGLRKSNMGRRGRKLRQRCIHKGRVPTTTRFSRCLDKKPF